jgi:hypothetical protein
MDIAGHPAPSAYGQYFQQYVRYMQWLKARWIKCGNHPRAPPADEVARQLGQQALDGVNLYENSILQWAGTRRFCVTEYGRIGWLPPEAKAGDMVCVFKGAETPHLLRVRDDGRLVLVGWGMLSPWTDGGGKPCKVRRSICRSLQSISLSANPLAKNINVVCIYKPRKILDKTLT